MASPKPPDKMVRRKSLGHHLKTGQGGGEERGDTKVTTTLRKLGKDAKAPKDWMQATTKGFDGRRGSRYFEIRKGRGGWGADVYTLNCGGNMMDRAWFVCHSEEFDWDGFFKMVDRFEEVGCNKGHDWMEGQHGTVWCRNCFATIWPR